MKKIAIVYGELKNDIQKKALELISSVILEQTIAYPVCAKYSDFNDAESFRCIYNTI